MLTHIYPDILKLFIQKWKYENFVKTTKFKKKTWIKTFWNKFTIDVQYQLILLSQFRYFNRENKIKTKEC